MRRYKSIFLITLIYFFFLTVGYIYGSIFSTSNGGKIEVRKLEDFNYLETFFKIGIKNTVAFLVICSSIFLSNKIVYLFFIINGYILGVFISKFSSLYELIVILPHGIIEMISFILAGYFSICIINDKKRKYYRYLLFSFFLMLIAVVIESTITPMIVKLIY